MKNKFLVSSVIFIIVLIFSLWVLAQEKNIQSLKNNEPVKNINSGIILFYGNGCPHCAIIEKYIQDNRIQDKINFKQKEVYYNQINSKELQDKAKICGINQNSIGVPFLWDNGTCLLGDKSIIDFFRNKIYNN